MLEKILQVVGQELSGDKALDFTERLTHFHRLPGSSGYHDAANCVEEMLRASGVENIARHRVPLAQGVKYWKWNLGRRCYQDEARLELVEPWPELLLDTHSLPICIARDSQPTPPFGEVGELVDVGAGDVPEHYEGVDVAGKVVLAHGKPDVVAALAIQECGAIGVLNSVLLMEWPPLRTRHKFPELIQWQGLSAANRKQETARGWGFAISHTLYLRLQELLRKGRVIVKAVVKGGWRDSHFDNIIATVPGDEPQGRQFWFVAHLCHTAPGAGDNASGCGLMIEIVRALTTLVATGQIARPKADIKFLFCPEMIGSLAYVHDHLRQLQDAIGGFCLDMVGHDQAKTGGALFVTRAPNSLPSIISDLTAAFLEMQEQSKQFWKIDGRGPFKYVVGPYVGHSDHYNFCDAEVGVPMVSFIHWPDVYYHTSHDTIDKMSAHTFSVVGTTAASVAMALSFPSEPTLRQALEYSAHAAEHRLQELAENARRKAEVAVSLGNEEEAAQTLSRAQVDLEKAVETEIETLRKALSILPICFEPSRITTYLEVLAEGLKHQAKAQTTRLTLLTAASPAASLAAPLDSPIPTRISHGPLDYRDFFQTTTPEEFEALILASELWNSIDGTRSLDEIKCLMRVEYGALKEEVLDRLFNRMVELGHAAT